MTEIITLCVEKFIKMVSYEKHLDKLEIISRENFGTKTLGLGFKFSIQKEILILASQDKVQIFTL